MRRLIYGLSLLLLGPTVHLAAAVQLPERDRVRLAEAIRLSDELSEQLWPTWGRTPLAVLLVTDSTEFLTGHPKPTADFVRLGHDVMLGRDVWTRSRHFPPTLLATFPAVGVPTIVIGSAERTGKSSTAWVLTLLHEHFHQWQYTQPDYYSGVARLNLAHGDSTGQWMLDYAFPYGSRAVQSAMGHLATALVSALDAPSNRRHRAVKDVRAARDRLRGTLTPADYRYLEFQLWQEGVSRYIEYAAARAAAELKEPSPEFRSLPDYESYSVVAARARRDLRRELEHLDLRQQRRITFYPVGAALALLLEETRSDWKRVYSERPFALAALLPAPLR